MSKGQEQIIEYGGGHANPTLNLQVGCLVTSGILQSHDCNITKCRDAPPLKQCACEAIIIFIDYLYLKRYIYFSIIVFTQQQKQLSKAKAAHQPRIVHSY